MALVIITLRVMPKDVNQNLKELETDVIKEISDFGCEVVKVEIEPIAFGLKALKIIFTSKESKGSVEDLEEKIKSLEGVKGAGVIDVRRTIG